MDTQARDEAGVILILLVAAVGFAYAIYQFFKPKDK